MKRVAILGSAVSGGAAQIIEALINSTKQKPELILDNDKSLKESEIHGVKVMG